MAERLERCATCRWWLLINDGSDLHPIGQCHRRAPRTKIGDPTEDGPFLACWPETFPDEFCGEWAPTKVAALKDECDALLRGELP